MITVVIAGQQHQFGGRVADIIVWLVERRHLIEFGPKWIEFTCRGDSILARHGEEERIERRRPN